MSCGGLGGFRLQRLILRLEPYLYLVSRSRHVVSLCLRTERLRGGLDLLCPFGKPA